MAKGKRKVHSLTGRITSKLVFEAWRSVRRNRGAAGIDKVSIRMFEQNLEANLEALKEGKKMKMQDYGDVWYQFQLEKQGALIRKHTKAMQGRRKIVRR